MALRVAALILRRAYGAVELAISALPGSMARSSAN
jgi:hypothetical protein